MQKNIYNQTLTILNKLKSTDNTTGLDVWQKTVITDGVWYPQTERTISGPAVYIGSFIKVLIPFNKLFLEYSEWKQTGNQEGHYTMSAGDYIVLGTVSETITSQNIVATMKKYGENVCQVKSKVVKQKRFGATVQLSVEGV